MKRFFYLIDWHEGNQKLKSKNSVWIKTPELKETWK